MRTINNYGFDTFTGLPEDWYAGKEIAHNIFHVFPFLKNQFHKVLLGGIIYFPF